MLLPAELMSQELVPWVMALPILPLAFMISRKNLFTGMNIALLLCSVITLLTNVFQSLMIQKPDDLRMDMYLVGVLLEFAIAMILLWNSTSQRFIRGLILATGVMFCGAISALIFMLSAYPDIKPILNLGYFMVFLLSVAALAERSYDSQNFLTERPYFWVLAGLLFHFGTMSLLLIVETNHKPASWAGNRDFALLFTISTAVRYTLFSTSVVTGRIYTAKAEQEDVPG